jgi:hypothetical protein
MGVDGAITSRAGRKKWVLAHVEPALEISSGTSMMCKAGGTAKAVNAAIVPPEIVFWRIFYVISRHPSSC